MAGNAASIDAIVEAPQGQFEGQQHEVAMDSRPTSPENTSRRLKGKKRLILGLQRISSSPSLARMTRSATLAYRPGGRASISCASLSSLRSPYDGDYNGSYESEFSQQYSTAPTSLTSSPGPSTPTVEHRPRARTIGRDGPMSVGLPGGLKTNPGTVISEVEEDNVVESRWMLSTPKRRKTFNFWNDMPSELKSHILSYLDPKEIVRCSVVSKSWHRMCFDGQLWKNLDTTEYYQQISANSLVNLISSAGPFVRDLNLRGCVQLREHWGSKGKDGVVNACRNLENFSLEGCLIDRSAIQLFLGQNSRLKHINLSGLPGVTNSAMKIIGAHCPNVEHLNVTWCQNLDTRGLRRIVEGCPNLRDLRAGEIRGWGDVSFTHELFKRNTIERLVLTNCDSLTDESLSALFVGIDGEFDFIQGRVICPPRRLKHLDLTRCRSITDTGLKALAHNVPELEGLQLSKCAELTDSSLTEIFPTMLMLTHLDLEELEHITNASLQSLTSSPSAQHLRHLSISYCELLSDQGMVPLLKACPRIESLDLDNTRISDLVLIEAANVVRDRNRAAGRAAAAEASADGSVTVGLRMVVFDCANVTWTGVREILSRNAENTGPPALQLKNPRPGRTAETASKSASTTTTTTPSSTTASLTTSRAPPAKRQLPAYHHSIISLKAFYTWQPTIAEHTKRVLRGDFAAACRLERKWAEWMMVDTEVANGGRRRRRRMREALEAVAGEEAAAGVELMGSHAAAGIGNLVARRRRARSGPTVIGQGSCVVM